jgi:serine/threonine protein kinase
LGKEARVGKYVLVRRLAKGGMAELYLANQTGPSGFQKPVTIKRILPNLTQDKSFVSMFLNEARIAAQLTHPNIVQIYDLGKAGDSYYIAMEYVDGLDLEWILGLLAKTSGRIPLDCAAAIAARVTDALYYAHRQTDIDGRPLNIVHRDVTPGNVMVSHQGVVKLVDFGIAKATAQLEKTNPGVLKGKFFYLSPEQTLRMPVDHRTDLFSLGVLLYEVTTGKRPFDGTDPVEIVHAIRDRQPPPPTEVLPGYPKRLSDIVMKAMEKDRLRRYRNAREMQMDLEAYLSRSGTPAGTVELVAMMREVAALKANGSGEPKGEVAAQVPVTAPEMKAPAQGQSDFDDQQPTDPDRDKARSGKSELDAFDPELVTVLSVKRPANLTDSQPFDPFSDDPAGVELVMAGAEPLVADPGLDPGDEAPTPAVTSEGLGFIPSGADKSPFFDEATTQWNSPAPRVASKSEEDGPITDVHRPRTKAWLLVFVALVCLVGAIAWRSGMLPPVAHRVVAMFADHVEAPPEPPPVPATVRILVASHPVGATVTRVDTGEVLGITPFDREFPRGGTIELRFSLKGYAELTHTTKLEDSGSVLIEFPDRKADITPSRGTDQKQIRTKSSPRGTPNR